jgi:catechol 2,3-dioxygenase-like lactoylglutathione lyase family enzyme
MPNYGRHMRSIQPHALHRVAIAVNDVTAAEQWLTRVVGAASVFRHEDSESAEVMGNLAGTATYILWSCGYPVVLLHGPMVERFLARRGPGVQSMAWEVDDNWASEHAVRDRGIDIISPNVEGRFFFMQPKQTSGLLIEYCDGWMERHIKAPVPDPGLVGTVELAWVTGVVADAEATAVWMQDLMHISEVVGNPAGDEKLERTIDLAVGNTTVRLVTPTSPESRYHEALGRGPAWHSLALRVPDLDDTLGVLAAEGIGTVYRDGPLVATDPAATIGLKIDWTE